MSSFPTVYPVNPTDSGGAYSANGRVLFQLRDGESRISLNSLFVLSCFSSSSMPSAFGQSPYLVERFSDLGAAPNLTDNVDLSFVSGSYLLQTPADDTEYNSAISIKTEVEAISDIVGISVRLNIAAHSTIGSNTPRPYFNATTDFTGVSAAFSDLSNNKLINLFFCSGATPADYTIVVAGPAQDAAGSRTTHTISFDWSVTNTYSVILDYRRDVVYVLAAVTEEADDTIIYKGQLSLFGDTLSSYAVAGLFQVDEPNYLALTVSQDGRQLGDAVYIEDYSIFSTGFPLVHAGTFTKYSSDGIVEASSSYVRSREVTSLRVTGIAVKDVVDSYQRIRTQLSLYEERFYANSLKNDGWAMLVSAGISSIIDVLEDGSSASSNLGVNTGTGFDVFCSKKVQIRFIEEFGILYLGIKKNLSNNTALSDFFISNQIDRTRSKDYIVCCTPNGEVEVFTVTRDDERKTELLVSCNLSDLETNSTGENYFSIISEDQSKDVLYIRDLALLPTAVYSHSSVLFKPIVAPSSATYTISASTSETQAIQKIKLPVTSNSTSGEYYTFSRYSPGSSGIILSTILDIYYTALSPEKEYGPFFLMNSGDRFSPVSEDTQSVQLYVVVSKLNKIYAYLSSSPTDYLEVARQTARGRAYSFEVQTKTRVNSATQQTETYVCIPLTIEYKPAIGVTVYNYNIFSETLLFVPWSDTSGIERTHPNIENAGYYIPNVVDSSDTHFSFAIGGAVPTSSITSVCFSNLIVGIGRGYDVSMYLNSSTVSIPTLYGRKARFIVDVGDVD